MTLDESIQELTRYTNEPYSNLHPYFTQATKIGIEAQKVLRHGRRIGAHHDPALLPGETKE